MTSTPCGRVELSIVTVIAVLPLLLQFAEVVVEAIEARLPMPPVIPDPVGDVAQRSRSHAPRPPLRLASPLDQTRSLQHPQVLRDRGLGHVERRRQLLDRCLAGS